MMSMTSPFSWDGKTLKIKETLDRYIALNPQAKEIPIYQSAHLMLLKIISPSVRHRYEKDGLYYHGRKLTVKR
jgi:hypothetical protein